MAWTNCKADNQPNCRAFPGVFFVLAAGVMGNHTTIALATQPIWVAIQVCLCVPIFHIVMLSTFGIDDL